LLDCLQKTRELAFFIFWIVKRRLFRTEIAPRGVVNRVFGAEYRPKIGNCLFLARSPML
jgi:hypothetical protein